MARVLTIIVILALIGAGYLIVSNYDSTYKVLPMREEAPVQNEQEAAHETILNQASTETSSSDPYIDWRAFTSENGSFEVLLPTVPQRAEDTIQDPNSGEQRKYEMYVAKKGNGSIFMISLITYPGKSELPVEKILESVKDEMVHAHPGNRLISSELTKLNGHDAIDFSIENPEAHIDGSAFLIDRTLYLLTHVANKDSYDRAEFKHFAQSFKVK